MKYFILLLFSTSLFAQEIIPLTTGTLITQDKLINNFNVLKEKMMTTKYFSTFTYSLPSGGIKKQDLQSIVSLFSNKLGVSSTYVLSSEIKASEINSIFSSLNIAISNYRYLSCKDLLTKQPHLINLNNNYNIQPQTTANESVYCDMTTEGGGWTRISATLASSNYGFDSSQYNVYARNTGVDCSIYSPSVRLTNLKISDWSIARDDFYRTTLTQCVQLNYQSGGTIGEQGNYYRDSGGVYRPVATCGWAYQPVGPTPWDNNSSISMGAGEANNIRITRDFLQTRSAIEFTSSCTNATDNGFITHTFFVK